MRLAGTARQYSGSAINQLMAMNPNNGIVGGALRCQYHATVMKTLEAISSRMVVMRRHAGAAAGRAMRPVRFRRLGDQALGRRRLVHPRLLAAQDAVALEQRALVD